ncbi:MAG: hypothetical protein M3Q58_11605 [Bacteroidota bacterium]|nr:hypothetical protein [Bacteroidota bacterium]
MQFENVKQLIQPLIKGGQEWQYISINGTDDNKPRFYFSNVQWGILIFSALILLQLPKGISKDIIGYIVSAFAISITLFMSLLVSIFDKFENTKFETKNKTESEIVRLVQKRNFFKRFISITSYLVILAILIIVISSMPYIFDFLAREVKIEKLVFTWSNIDLLRTFKNTLIVIYRIALNYFLLNYLFLTLFVAGSAYEYYISELNIGKIN